MKNFKSIFSRALILVMLLSMISVGAPAFADEPTNSLELAVISDLHIYNSEVLGKGEALDAYLAKDRKLLKESVQILDEAIERILASDAEYVLISGDMTKDGERVNHELVAERLELLEKGGKQVFLINGNHDISNEHAASFIGANTERVETIDSDDFKQIYNDFGYGEAIAKDPNSLSYAANLGDGYRLIAMDACTYNDDKDAPEQKTAGSFSEETLNWAIAQTQAAIKEGRIPIGMLHHGLVPHTAVQPLFFSEYLVKDYRAVSAKLADAGMGLVFTGHFHSLDAAVTVTAAGNKLYDFETGSTVTYPSPIRYISLKGAELTYTSDFIHSVEGIDNFGSMSQSYLMEGLVGQVPGLLAKVNPTFTPEMTQIVSDTQLPGTPFTVGQFLAGSMAKHYAGDEEPGEYAPIIAALQNYDSGTPSMDGLYHLLGNAAYALANDTTTDAAGKAVLETTPDRAGKLTLEFTPIGHGGYEDVKGHWAEQAIDFVSVRGLFEGTGENTFSPEVPMSRAMLVTVLWRMEGSSVPSTSADFSDVGEDAWYADAIAWAAANDIVEGYDNGKFGPDDNISREQLATILYRYEAPGQTEGSLESFPDRGSVSSWASDAMKWAVGDSLVRGDDRGMLNPTGNATRAQVATVLQRFVSK